MFLVYWIAMGPFGTFLTDWTNDVLGANGFRGLPVSCWRAGACASG